MKVRPFLALGLPLALPLLLGGCLTGTNVHGDFACRAPGGTCAPMANIDAQAIAGIGAVTTTQSIDSVPIGSAAGSVYRPRDLGSNPGRTADRAFKIVFPAHIDGSGIYHNEASAHVVVERGEWTDGLTGGTRPANVNVTASSVGPARTAPSGPGARPGSVLASLDDIVAARSAKEAETNAGASAADVQASGVAASPSSVPAWVPASAPSASPFAQSLREAVAASDGGKLDKLDGSYDTPDVTAVSTARDTSVSPAIVAVSASTRKVRWHGRLYEIPPKRPATSSSVQIAAAPAPAMPAQTPTASVALNQASLARMNPAAPRTAIAAPGSGAVQTGAVVEPAVPATAAPYPLTADARVAAARVKAMAAPVIEGRATTDRTAVGNEPALGAMLGGIAGLSSTASAFSTAAGAVSPTTEPRP